MKGLIIGFGHVGRALWEVEKETNQIYVCDINQKVIEGIPRSSTALEDLIEGIEVVQICIPALLVGYTPNTEVFYELAQNISKLLTDDSLVILESTVPVGTTREVSRILGSEFLVAHSPVRGEEPHMKEDILKLVKFVGGINKESTVRAVTFYESSGITCKTIRSPETTEFFKLANNTWQDINIAYANELARLGAYYDVAIEEVLKMIKSDPMREVRFPGFVGGDCVPVNPHFLNAHLKTPLIQTARKINTETIKQAAKMVEQHLTETNNKEVLVVGLSYKPNTPSLINAPSLAILKELQGKFKIYVSDPNISAKDLEPYGIKVEDVGEGFQGLILMNHGEIPKNSSEENIITATTIWKSLKEEKSQ